MSDSAAILSFFRADLSIFKLPQTKKMKHSLSESLSFFLFKQNLIFFNIDLWVSFDSSE